MFKLYLICIKFVQQKLLQKLIFKLFNSRMNPAIITIQTEAFKAKLTS
jgi:hypothetical protein